MRYKASLALMGFSLVYLLLFPHCKTENRLLQVKESGFTQGTTYALTYYAEKNDPAIMMGIDSIFHVINYTASVYDSASIISNFNRGEASPQNEHFLKLVVASLEINNQTNGAFDITVGPIVQAWGFRKKEGKMVADSIVKELLSHTGCGKISVINDSVMKVDPLVQIDLNAIAQGYTVDLVAHYLMEHGIHQYLVEIGGEIRAGDAKPNDQPWVVGIEKPALTDTSSQVIQERINLVNQSIVTSGNYRNYFKQDGRVYSHTINPRTGYPVSDGLLSASIIAGNCMEADAYATALMAMGINDAVAFIEERPELEACLVFIDSTGSIALKFSPNFPPFLDKL